MTTIVISQPMYLPWIGIFDQISLADIFVHYDDVQLPQGRSFCTRVQVKTSDGLRWMTIPIDRKASGRLISETKMQPSTSWKQSHLALLHHSYARASKAKAMISLAEDLLKHSTDTLSRFNATTTEQIARTLGLDAQWQYSSDLNITGRSTGRLLEICKTLGATRYLTGHGAFAYLDHAAFEAAGITVEYMKYDPRPWPQIHGTFTPYVTALDLLAHVSPSDVSEYLRPQTVTWQDFDVYEARP